MVEVTCKTIYSTQRWPHVWLYPSTCNVAWSNGKRLRNRKGRRAWDKHFRKCSCCSVRSMWSQTGRLMRHFKNRWISNHRVPGHHRCQFGKLPSLLSSAVGAWRLNDGPQHGQNEPNDKDVENAGHVDQWQGTGCGALAVRHTVPAVNPPLLVQTLQHLIFSQLQDCVVQFVPQVWPVDVPSFLFSRHRNAVLFVPKHFFRHHGVTRRSVDVEFAHLRLHNEGVLVRALPHSFNPFLCGFWVPGRVTFHHFEDVPIRIEGGVFEELISRSPTVHPEFDTWKKKARNCPAEGKPRKTAC